MSPKLLRDRSALCPSPALGTPSPAATQWPAKSTAPTIWSYLLRYRAQPEEGRKEGRSQHLCHHWGWLTGGALYATVKQQSLPPSPLLL